METSVLASHSVKESGMALHLRTTRSPIGHTTLSKTVFCLCKVAGIRQTIIH